MLLHDILLFLNSTATETEVFQIHLAPTRILLETYQHLPDEQPKMIKALDYPDVALKNKPDLERLIWLHGVLRQGIANTAELHHVLCCTVHVPHMRPNQLVIDTISIEPLKIYRRIAPPKTYRLTIDGIDLQINADNPLFESQVYSHLNKEFGGDLFNTFLNKPVIT